MFTSGDYLCLAESQVASGQRAWRLLTGRARCPKRYMLDGDRKGLKVILSFEATPVAAVTGFV